MRWIKQPVRYVYTAAQLVKPQINNCDNVLTNIYKILGSAPANLHPIIEYYITLGGKLLRAQIVSHIASAANIIESQKSDSKINDNQIKIASFAEMIHTASLMHDDVVDRANTRRSQASINKKYGQRKPILAGNYIMGLASLELAKIGNPQVVTILSQTLVDLIQGELMQLGSRVEENERFAHYLKKTYCKAGSLIANSCLSVAILAQTQQQSIPIAESRLQMYYDFGKYIGIAFQIRDDILDLTGDQASSGKDCDYSDIKSCGIANSPLLFACKKFPELEAMIIRRFSQSGDVENAIRYIKESEGIQESQNLVLSYASQAKTVLGNIFNKIPFSLHNNKINVHKGNIDNFTNLPESILNSNCHTTSSVQHELQNLYNFLLSMCDFVALRNY